MSERQRWSHSSLVKLMRCGEAWRRSEAERDYAPPTSGMVRGSVVHAVAAEAHGRQIVAKQKNPDMPKSVVLRESLPGEDEAADLAASKFDLERKLSGIVAERDDSDPADEPAQKIIGRDKDSAIRMSRYLVTRVAPYVDPIAVEHKLSVEPKDADIRVSGIIDLVTTEMSATKDGPPRRGIRDYKTGKRAPNENEADSSGQLSMYALLDSLERGSIADVFALDHVIEDPRRFVGSPYLVTQQTTRSSEDLDVMVARLNNAIAGVKAGVFLANGVGTWYCSPKYCRWHPTCPYVRHGKR